MQLSPKSAIPVSYTASIPGDTTLYYVQAVLRDTASSTVLQTLNLTRESATPNRYTGSFNPVSDPSGLGRPVDITISVYTDSGHTTLSSNYEILQLSYVVLQPFIANLGNGGGGSNVSYEKIAATVLAAMEGKKTEDTAERVLGGIRSMPKTEIDYERLERIAQQLGERSSADTASAGDTLRMEIKELISGLSTAHAQGTDATHERIDAIMTALGDSESRATDRHTDMRGHIADMFNDMQTSLEKVPGQHRKDLEDKIADFAKDFQEYLRANLSEKEIRMVYNVTEPKKKNEKEEVQAGYDPMRVGNDLL